MGVFSKYFGGQIYVLFVGPLKPLLWTSGDVSSRFQSQSRQSYLHFVEAYIQYIFAEIHLWCDTCQPLGDQHGNQAIFFHVRVSRHWWGCKGLWFLCSFQRGNVYIADYSVLHGMNSMNQDTEHNNHIAAPMCLFLVQKSGNMRPIAIQLCQEVGSAIWTPEDGSEDWLLAKLFVRHADFLHQFVVHMLYCHLAMEPFVVATMRQLPQAHPVYKLLKPHFRLLFSFQDDPLNSFTHFLLHLQEGPFHFFQLHRQSFAGISFQVTFLSSRMYFVREVAWTNGQHSDSTDSGRLQRDFTKSSVWMTLILRNFFPSVDWKIQGYCLVSVSATTV